MSVTAASAVSQRALVLLIDGDRAQPSALEAVLEKAAQHGRVQRRLLHADFKAPKAAGWDEVVAKHTIKRRQLQQVKRGAHAVLTCAAG